MENIWKDLSVWQKEISKKDEALLRSKPVHDKVRHEVNYGARILNPYFRLCQQYVNLPNLYWII